MKILIIIIFFILNNTLVSNEWNFSEKFFDRGYQLVDMCKSNNNNVYVLFSDRSVGGTQNTIVLRSTDEGNTWKEIINLNPFENNTTISYYIPKDYSGQAKLMLTDEKGSSIIQNLEACIGKPCSISISANGLNAGVYIYSLVIDGNIIKSKKMMIIK